MKRMGVVIFSVLCLALLGLTGEPASWDGLGELTPEHPSGYLEMGEWILLNDPEGKDRALVDELLVRAVYWGQQRGRSGVASSACITLASMHEDDPTRRWLWDLALLIDPSRELEWAARMEAFDTERAALDREAAACVYAIRYHQMPEGAELFDRVDVRGRIFEAGDVAGVERGDLEKVLLKEIQSGKEDPCRGRLYVTERGGTGRRIACPDHLRGLGMCANDSDLRLLLRVEMVLAGIGVDSWSVAGSMEVDGVARLATVGDLVGWKRVNPSEAFYREGRWVVSP